MASKDAERIAARRGAQDLPAGPPMHRAIYLFFFLSGASALACQIVWLRKLGLVFGNTTHAVAAVLAVFMAGLGAGSYVVGRISGRWRSPLRAYGVLELVVGAWAALSGVLFGLLESWYVGVAQSTGASGEWLVAARVAGSFVLLFPPTFCMGATLPVLAGYCVRRLNSVGRGVGLLYGVNTLGAVAGTVAAGYVLVPQLGNFATLLLAAGANIAVGIAAMVLSAGEKNGDAFEIPASASQTAPTTTGGWLPAGLLLAGFVAIVYEVAWTRALAVAIGSSTYAFTIMLATFLLGIAGGSFLAERLLKRRAATVADWGWLQAGIALGALATLPFFDKIDFALMRFIASNLESPALHDAFRFALCSALMVFPTICMGALFPISVALHSRGADSAGRDVGLLYLCNTAGNLAGALAAGFLLVPALGIHRTLLLVVVAGGMTGLAAIFLSGGGGTRRALAGGLAACALVAGIALQRDGWDRVRMTSMLHYDALALGEHSDEDILAECYASQVVYYREGRSAVISVDYRDGAYTLRTNGKPDASTRLQDLRTQMLAGHLPMFFKPDAKRACVVGFGSGATAASVLKHGPESVDCVEIEPAVLDAAPWFESINGNCLADPRMRAILNDGRNHLLVDEGKYDVIVSEPSNPWIAGIATLFTTEFYELVDSRLAPGGVFCQWVQTYKMAPEDVQMIAATLHDVFPEVQVWSPNTFDLLLIAGREPLPFDVAAADRLLAENEAIRADLGSIGVRGAGGLLSFHLLRSGDAARYAEGAPFNRDDRLRLEFSAPRQHYRATVAPILQGLLARRSSYGAETLPEDFEKVSGVVCDMGHAALVAERLDDAETLFKRALELDPADAEASVGLARCMIARQQYAEAADQIVRAVELAPDNPVVLEAFGFLSLGQGNGQAAFAAFVAAYAANSWNWELRALAANALETDGRFAEAAQAHLQADEPVPVASRIAAARCMTAAGQHAEALALLDELAAAYPLDYRIHAQLADSARAAGDLEPALAAHREFARANPYSAFARERLAELEKEAN